MTNITIKNLKNTYALMRDILGYQRVLKMMGFSDKVLDRLDIWENEEQLSIEKSKKEYDKSREKRMNDLREFRKEIGGKEMRIKYLSEEKQKLEKSISLANEHNREMKDRFYNINDNLSWLRMAILSLYNVPEKKRKIKKIEGELRYLLKKDNVDSKTEINDEMIARATEYPFEQLIDLSRSKFILCPFHEDSRPSFFIKNNFGYCFSCNKSADTIEYVMKVEGLDFINAVKRLQ